MPGIGTLLPFPTQSSLMLGGSIGTSQAWAKSDSGRACLPRRLRVKRTSAGRASMPVAINPLQTPFARRRARGRQKVAGTNFPSIGEFPVDSPRLNSRIMAQRLH
jgi:hypothetical protein